MHGSPRSLELNPLPLTYDHIPTKEKIHETKKVYKGTPSPLTKMLGNIYAVIRPLRRQFYFEIGLDEDEQIMEIYPEWD